MKSKHHILESSTGPERVKSLRVDELLMPASVSGAAGVPASGGLSPSFEQKPGVVTLTPLQPVRVSLSGRQSSTCYWKLTGLWMTDFKKAWPRFF